MSTILTCPHCQSILKTSGTLLLGQSVRCPRCRAPFTVTAEPGSRAADVSADAGHVSERIAGTPSIGLLESARSGAPVAVAQPFQAPPAVGAPAVPEEAPRSQAGIIALVFLGLILFIGAGVALVIFCFSGESRPKDDPEPVALHLEPENPELKRIGAETTEPSPTPAPRKNAAAAKTAPAKPKPPRELPAGREASVPAGPASPAKDDKISRAIQKGIAFLKETQLPNGTWGSFQEHRVGYAALPALTLLECGVPASDPEVQRSARYVRMNAGNLSQTYDLALAILFLDRLGDPSDLGLIQTMALRLVAGQNTAGGWTYHCPVLTTQQNQQLMTFLHQTRPKHAPLMNPVGVADNRQDNPSGKGGATAAPLAGDAKGIQPVAGQVEPKAKTEADKNPALAKPLTVPEFVKQLPIGQLKDKKGKATLATGRDDNSNSQFALLALWVARRHHVPTERTLELAEDRYLGSQNRDGGWGYKIGMDSRDTMTCVGLLGLAMGHGTSEKAAQAVKNKNHKDAAKAGGEDPAIRRGLQALGQHIGTRGKLNLYFLWSVERVAMLYNLQTIGNKDWYAWGSNLLLSKQEADGSWFGKGYHGSATPLDTSFALLFLRRSNLVQDLTDNLILYMPITDPDAKRNQK